MHPCFVHLPRCARMLVWQRLPCLPACTSQMPPTSHLGHRGRQLPAAPCQLAAGSRLCRMQRGASHASVGPCSRAARARASVPALPGCREHQAALQAAVAGGVLQLVGTDHAVFNSTQKRVGRHDFRVIPNGVNGLEASGRASLAHPLRGGLRQLRAQLLALAVRGRLARRVLLHFFALPCTRVHVRAAPAGQGPGRRQPAAAMPCAVCRLPSQRCVHPVGCCCRSACTWCGRS